MEMDIGQQWITKGKTISQLIEELSTFENQNLEVQISMDGGETHKPISIIGNFNGLCLLINCED